MNILYTVMDCVRELPELLNLLLCPGLLVVIGCLLAFFGKKKAYPPLALALGAAGFFLVYCTDAGAGFPYLALYIVLAVLVRLLFLIPFKRRAGDNGDALYEKFHAELDVGDLEQELDDRTYCGSEESDLQLAHTTELLEKLKKSDLAAGDRLEVDSLSRTIEGLRGRDLTTEEMRSLNDCLATILKLTAKYKL